MNEAIHKAIEEAAHMGYVEGIKTAIEVLQGILERTEKSFAETKTEKA
jgi:hypothetical protein